eukprot:TRINITY_DN236_c1_g2_i1.p1 TRINITY_DN236_c1_g2~~TRINITY_DN236_c1_g2_i1.p1  ORF type:complete len:137 (+),score=30.52 TRINITY_DN236_c1_g2_i1:70-480(+)
MGRISLEQIVYTVDRQIEQDQVEARNKIFELILAAKKEDPPFFEIPYNPFVEDDENEEIDEDDDEEEEQRSLRWFAGLKASSSPTAKEILKIRKELFKKVSASLDQFRYNSPITNITPNSIFASLYCRLLQLDHVV